MRYFGHSDPFSLKEGVHLEFTYKISVERRAVEHMLVLKVPRQVDTVVLTDIPNSLGRQQPGMSTDAHGIEDMATALEITGECPVGDTGKLRKLFLADEFMLIVIIDHKKTVV